MKEKIKQLAKKKNAIILAHNYQPPEIQDIADLCGDSLELSIKAAKTDADIIVFCGVHFMAETAFILSPEKTILLPNTDAGCPMADMVDPISLAAKKKGAGEYTGYHLCEFFRCSKSCFRYLLYICQCNKSCQQH